MLKSICLVRVLITVAEVVILENSIGFLGLSAGAGAVSLGELLANGWHNFFLAPWILLESSLALFGLLFLLFWKARTIQENWQKTCFLE
jgi:ABC-type dipeptide/oligopeptide/nickel transport system permease subunit